jgi:hypothetical protein
MSDNTSPLEDLSGMVWATCRAWSIFPDEAKCRVMLDNASQEWSPYLESVELVVGPMVVGFFFEQAPAFFGFG